MSRITSIFFFLSVLALTSQLFYLPRSSFSTVYLPAFFDCARIRMPSETKTTVRNKHNHVIDQRQLNHRKRSKRQRIPQLINANCCIRNKK